ncbi:MAG: site-2 protease family protein [Terriglobales bacterium]
MEQYAAEARAFEEKGEYMRAREPWQMSLPLLPPESKQAAWIRGHLLELEQSARTAPPLSDRSKWGKQLAALGLVGFFLFKFKSVIFALFKLKFLASLASFVAVYWALYGVKFGVGFAVSILIHEMGHYIDIKRRGLPAEMPVFLPGLGAYVKWQALGVSNATRAAISLAGPLAGWLAAMACLGMWWKTGEEFWGALARTGAWLNVLNLIPVWVLDGGQAAVALTRAERAMLLVAALGLWWGLGESVFVLIALGAGYRLFTKDAAAEPNYGITAYYLVLMVILGLVMWTVPVGSIAAVGR